MTELCLLWLPEFSPEESRPSLLLQNPRTPEGFLKGSLKGPRTCLSRRTLQNAFKNPSKTFQEGVEIDDALGFQALKNQFQGPGVL